MDKKTTLEKRFLVNPFSVLDTRKGAWRKRIKYWKSLGIESEVGRKTQLTFAPSAQPTKVYELRNEMRAAQGKDPSWAEVIEEAKRRKMYLAGGTSIFDPVLCELMYTWFTQEGWSVFDPFAGGSVRGIVAGKLKRKYEGVDLSFGQVRANQEQAFRILPEEQRPVWHVADSGEVSGLLGNKKYDFILSCPPYYNLEKYSDSPKDLSAAPTYEEFAAKYTRIIRESVARLKENRFAVFVVSQVREAHFYVPFVCDTIRAFHDAGAKFYNDMVLLNELGSLPMRVSRPMKVSRKVGRCHQNVLVFYKGDPSKIREMGPIDLNANPEWN